MADLPSILGGMAQGFVDFGKGVVDMFGTGGAAIGDLIEGARTGKVTTKNQDNFRKWLYQTDSTKDAAAKGLGTALNGVQTVLDYIPGVNVLTRNPLGNAAQGALGGLADEFKTYGEDYDLGRAGQRAAVSGAAAAASGSLADALKGSSNALLSSNTLQGLARGATGGAITGGGYAAIDGGDVLEAAKQGAGMGALIGGATGAFQDFKPAKTYDMALSPAEKQARIENAQAQIDDIGPVSRFSNNPDDIAKRARITELQDAIKAYQGGFDTVDDYKAAMANKKANRPETTTGISEKQQAQDYMMAHRPTQTGIYADNLLAEGADGMAYPKDVYDNPQYYTFMYGDTPDVLNETMAQLNAVRNNPNGEITIYRATPGNTINDGDWITLSKTYADLHNQQQLGGKGNVLSQKVNVRDVQPSLDDLAEWGYYPQKRALETTLASDDMAVNAPSENMKLYRGISAPDDATLQRYIDEMKDPNIAPTTHSGGSAYGQGYYFTPDEGLARYYANESGLPSTAIMEIEVPRNRFTEISKENGNRPADFDLAAVKRGVPEDIRYETGLKDFNDYLDNNGYWGSRTSGENPTYTIMRNDAVLNAKRIDTPSLETTLADADMAVNNPRYLTDENGNPRTFYHGSPNKNITEFDINQAGKNTSSGEHALYFTDSPEVADEFSYERLPSDSMFVDNRGAKGRVYPVNLAMDNPLDLSNLSDKQIEELWQYASPLGKLDGKEKFIKNMKAFRDYGNDQLIKTNLDLDKLANSQYDGFTARMYPNQANQAREYAVFDNSKVKMLEDVLANDDASVNGVMESRITPGQLGLFDDMPTQTPKTGTRQTSLFDQPDNPYLDYYGADIDATPLAPETPANPYAPVDGKLTQAMKDRYWELMSDANQFKYTGADNDLYNKINPETLPKGYKELQHLLDTQDTPENMVEEVLKNKVGTDSVWKADTDRLLDYVWGGDNHEKKMYYKTLEDEIERAKKNAVALGLDNYNAEEELTKAKRQDLQLKAYKKAELEALDKVIQVSDTDDIMHALSNYNRRGIRTGDAGALDTVLSERLGIAPGNTIKITKNVGGDLSKSAAGRYARNARDIAVSDINSPEGKVSTMAHERLHSFQNEARPESAGRYDPEVVEAYKQLQKDLGHYYKSNSEIKKRYKRDVDYWASSGEQESRMFQQYLENKGYTDNSAWRKMGGKADEWGNEINPAFDKFIDKLRDLSKRGVALPALAALFGGGAYMASQENDKEKEVK